MVNSNNTHLTATELMALYQQDWSSIQDKTKGNSFLSRIYNDLMQQEKYGGGTRRGSRVSIDTRDLHELLDHFDRLDHIVRNIQQKVDIHNDPEGIYHVTEDTKEHIKTLNKITQEKMNILESFEVPERVARNNNKSKHGWVR